MKHLKSRCIGVFYYYSTCCESVLLISDDNDGYRQRAVYLIKLIRLAQKYSSLKSYDINDVIGPGGKR